MSSIAQWKVLLHNDAMNIRRPFIILLIFLFGVSCSSHSVSPVEGIGAVSQTSQVSVTSTPTFPGTWEAIIEGVIYDTSTGTGQPVAGATISYEVLHSYFPELQEGRSNKAISGEDGSFFLTVRVHDTDSISVLIEAQGYRSYEERFSGFDLVAGKNLEIALIPLQ